MADPQEAAAIKAFMDDLLSLEERHTAPLTNAMRSQLWEAVQASGHPDFDTLERGFHMMAEHVYGEPRTEPEDAAEFDEFDDDDEGEFFDDEADDPTDNIAGRISVVEEQIGRRLTGDEHQRVADSIADGSWDVERVVADAGVKDFGSMNEQEERDWFGARLGEVAPGPDLEVPVDETGRVDFGAMGSDDVNQYMADRASGIEYEDVIGEAG